MFGPEQGDVERSRLGYAFRVFCALYGHDPVWSDSAEPADMSISYEGADRSRERELRLGNGYRGRALSESAPPPQRFMRDGVETFLIHAPIGAAEPDWLGEIFEWLSCADEYSRSARDRFGRLPYSDCYIGRHGLDPCTPWAAVAMNFLAKAMATVSPFACARPAVLIAATHDVDTLPGNFADSLKRILRYAAVTTLMYRRPASSMAQIARAARAGLLGRHPFAQAQRLSAAQHSRRASATYFLIASQQDRRDANYDVTEAGTREFVRQLCDSGLEVGSHGSFRSLDRPGELGRERARLASAGVSPVGNRQHYLRFTVDRLVREVEQAGFAYDCSLGWGEEVGFRAGACFAFPPYNFDEERPARFLELPMVVMDATLRDKDYSEAETARVVNELLETTARYGPGGVSILWHPETFEGVIRPMMLDRVYWRIWMTSEAAGHRWTSAINVVRELAPRFARAGMCMPPSLQFDRFTSTREPA